MDKINQQIIDQAEQIANSQGYRITNQARESASHWRVNRVKRIIFPCEKLPDNTSGPEFVLLKYRPENSIISKQRFITNESSSKALNEQLSDAGITAQRTLKTSFNQPPEWIIREFLQGRPLGNFAISAEIDTQKFFDYLISLRKKLDCLTGKIDRDLLNPYEWQEKLRNEFAERRHFLTDKIDSSLLATFDNYQDQHLPELDKTVLHGDLAPTNILLNQGEFQVIDWGEVSIGPALVDWMIVWSTAVYHPDFQKQILETVLSVPSENLETVKGYVIKVASRMLSTFAEGLEYYKSHPEEDEIYRQEITSVFPLAKTCVEKLIKEIGSK